MEGLVFVVLPMVVLFVLGIAAWAFFDVAFARQRAVSREGVVQGRLPLLSGEALRRWATDLAQQVVAKHARQHRTIVTAVELAHEIEGLTSQVISESLQHVAHGHSTECAQCSRETIRLTGPETLAIADDLRRRLSRRELREIRSRAETNARPLAASDQPQAVLGLPLCPLLSQYGCCASYESRPVYCRGHCPNCKEENDLSADDKQRSDGAFAVTVAQGVTEGLTQGLAAAGWDGQLYELNAALLRALDLPDAAARWARGEAVFDSCQQFQSLSSG